MIELGTLNKARQTRHSLGLVEVESLTKYAGSYATTYVRELYPFWSTYELYTSRRTRTSYVSAKSR